MQTLEAIAVILAVAYLLLAAREHIACWYCAFISSAIYSVLFWDVSLLMDSVLNVFYVIMAVVGWYEWQFGGRDHHGVHIRRMTWRQHGLVVVGLLVVTGGMGWYMQHYTREAWPYLDTFTTWASVLTTFLVVWKVLENWLYWIVIDGISIVLYVERGLYLTALLFATYVVIVVFGYLQWRKRYAEQVANAND